MSSGSHQSRVSARATRSCRRLFGSVVAGGEVAGGLAFERRRDLVTKSVAWAHRLANTQPLMRCFKLGMRPGISASLVALPVSEEPSFGTAPSKPRV
jgi:hypothetical protein